MNAEQITRVQKALRLEAVPARKAENMVQRTILGALFVGLGIYSAVSLGWGKEWSIGLVLFGATIWSRQVVTATLMALVQPIKAIRRAADKEDTP